MLVLTVSSISKYTVKGRNKPGDCIGDDQMVVLFRRLKCRRKCGSIPICQLGFCCYFLFNNLRLRRQFASHLIANTFLRIDKDAFKVKTTLALMVIIYYIHCVNHETRESGKGFHDQHIT